MADEQKSHDHHHVTYLLESLVLQYKALEHERRLLRIWEGDKDYSILGVIELYSTYISGYASQLAHNFAVSQPKRAVDELATWSFFGVDYCYRWFYDSGNQLEGMKLHVLQLDYLRLSTAEYIRKYQLPNSATPTR